MAITADDIRNAILLSTTAYLNSDGIISNATLSNAHWVPLGSDPVPSGLFQGDELPRPASLGLLESWDTYFGVGAFDTNFIYDNGTSQALVVRSTTDQNTLAIAFRGSTFADQFGNLRAGITSFQLEYNKFAPLIQSLKKYIADEGITRVLVTGHSLGGALAEQFMEAHPPGAGVEYVGVTFGSPSDWDTASNNDVRLVNFGHTEDAVVNVAAWDGPRDVDVNRLDASGFAQTKIGLAEFALAYAVFGNLYEHDYQSLYQSTAQIIASSPAFPKFIANAPAYRVTIGTVASDTIEDTSGRPDFMFGSGNDDVLKGGGGDDILDGGANNDTITGGFGDDFIIGGIGTDTAVFNLTRADYSLSYSNDEIHFRSSLEGSDTVRNDVELFRFLQDGAQYTFAEMVSEVQRRSQVTSPTPSQADTTAPVLVSKLPADNQSNVAVNSNFTLTFDEPVFGSGSIEIRRSDNGQIVQTISVTDQAQVTGLGTSTVTINPAYNLASGTGYYISVGGTVFRDAAGNQFTGITNSTSYNFTTASQADTARPVLTATSPSDNSNSVSTTANIQLTFDELVFYGSGNIDIYRGDGSLFRSISIFDTSQISFNLNTITINPIAEFATSTDYEVRVGSTVIRDLAGNFFTGIVPSALSFTTAAAPAAIPVAPPRASSIFMSIADNSVREGPGGTTILSFGVTLSGPGAGTQTVSVQYATEDIAGAASPALAGQDYIAASSVLVIPAGQTSGTIEVRVFGDGIQEADEVFRLVLSQPSAGVTLLNSSGQTATSIFATGFITNDDAPPNHIPVTAVDIAITAPGTPIAVNVLANDSDPDGNALSIANVFDGPGTPLTGNATYSVSGSSISIAPNAGFSGILSFRYVVDDGASGLQNGFGWVIVGGDGTAPVVRTGSINDDILVGTNGNDVLSGGFGDDIIAGGRGADRIDGGAGFNWLDLRTADHRADMRFQDPWIADDGFGDHDILQNIQGVLGTPYDDDIDGTTGTAQQVYTGFRFYGNDGNDRLQSGAGDDVLDGGAGNDLLIYGAGHDMVFGGAGNDAIEIRDGGGDTVGDELHGGSGNDTIAANQGRSPDFLFGDDGNDTFSFGDGDTVIGGEGADLFFIGGFNSAVPFRARIVDIQAGEEIRWTVRDPVFLTPSTVTWFTGLSYGDGTNTSLDQVQLANLNGDTVLYYGFDANPGADFILTLNGTFTIDQFQAVNPHTDFNQRFRILPSAGNDTVIVGLSNQSTFNGGSGNDVIDYSVTNQNISVNLSLAGNQASGSEIGVHQLAGIEGVIAGGGNDQLVGNAMANQFEGGGGNDTVSGGSSGRPSFVAWGLNGAVDRIADFNGDGKADVLELGSNGTLKVSLSNAANANAFGVNTQWGSGSRTSDLVGDFNGDGRADIIELHGNGNAYVWLANSTGTGFSNYSVWGSGFTPHYDKIADVNGDGKDDIVEIDSLGRIYAWTANSNGTGFNSFQRWGSGARSSDQLGDFNGDGKADIIELHENGNAYVWLANANGQGFQNYTVWGSGFSPRFDRIADVNGDGKDDILEIDSSGRMYAWTANSSGTGFNSFQLWGSGARSTDQVGDFNGDGKADVIELHENGNAYVWLANANGQGFQNYTVWGSGFSPRFDRIADVNGDGKDDIVELDSAGRMYVWTANNSGTGFNSFQLWGTGVTTNQPTGSDTFVYRPNFGNDRIEDFEAGPGSGDLIHFAGSMFVDFNDVITHTTDTAQGAVIRHDTSTLTLVGVSKAQLNADDFLLG